MKFISKVLLITATIVFALLSVFPAYAADVAAPHTSYFFKSYDIQMEVTEDNTLNITETILAHFNVPKHGIYRKIPLSNNVNRADGTSGKTHAKVRGLKVSDNYSTSIENGNYVIQIGDENVTLTGDHEYKISYSYVMGQDIGEGYDELYYNLIGNSWDTYSENVTFSITMPKEFDESKLGFSTGVYGTAGTDDIEYYVNGNTISGRLTEKLSPYEAFTVRLELPEGYFYFNLKAYYTRLALMAAIPFICLSTVVLLWFKFGRDKKVVDVIEFYPPDGMSSLDVAFWKKGMVSSNDAIPLMIELANEGYIKICETAKKSRLSVIKSNAFEIEYVKYYDGPDKNKKNFFAGLFETHKNRVRQTDLEDRFYVHINRIISDENSLANRKRVYNAKSLYMRILGWAVSILGGVASALIFMGTIGGTEKFLAFAAGILISIAAFLFSFFIKQRTEKGYENLQKINGFKKFLETAEKERLETLVDENPEYYYNILPYAYVLGVSDVWTKKFESIALEPPHWYDGGTFNRVMFWSFMNSTMSSAAQTMTSSPQSSSSGGGGFSGGGSGGGGGGSW